MKYYIQRQLNEYGPYTLADLQRYVAQGSILLTDLTRSEGMTDWVPVSQVIGNIPVQVAPMSTPGAIPAYGAGSVYGTGGGTVYAGGAGTTYGGGALSTTGPVPPDFHWALVLLIGICTCGLFSYAWLIVEAAFVRKIKPGTNALVLMIIAVAGSFGGGFITGFVGGVNHTDTSSIRLLITLIFAVVYWVGAFQMKSDLEEYYNSVEPINLQLSGVMTFFFALYYFQHHFSRIAQWKKSGVLQPQG
ncbi:MAG TPA: GYF domain-containing protein [Candidatus Angelobacter sp.]|nr:GYF domain-containing protein [Candidatus Angelobacter sp.]